MTLLKNRRLGRGGERNDGGAADREGKGYSERSVPHVDVATP